MKKQIYKQLCAALCFLAAFVLWTAAICFVDRQAVGPQGTAVGFAMCNLWFHNLTGVNLFLYRLTDFLELLPLAFAAGFALLGLLQWLCRKKLRLVDADLLLLGGLYLVLTALYFLFELLALNCRPVLLQGILESSYPSSTTLMVLCVIPTTCMQLNARLKHTHLKKIISAALYIFAVFTVIARLLSGVHWLSDIIGSILLSLALVLLYRCAVSLPQNTTLRT